MRQRPRGEIKFTPNSFTVQEIISVGQRQVVVPLHRETLVHGRDGSAPVTLFHLTKTGWTTEQAVREVARQMQVNERSISNYGLKDRYAHTSQRIGIKGDFHPEFDHKEIFLRQVGISQHPLRPGGNVGNRFCIEVLSAARDIDQNLFSKVPNFFGLQRVSSREDGKMARSAVSSWKEILRERLECCHLVILPIGSCGMRTRRRKNGKKRGYIRQCVLT